MIIGRQAVFRFRGSEYVDGFGGVAALIGRLLQSRLTAGIVIVAAVMAFAVGVATVSAGRGAASPRPTPGLRAVTAARLSGGTGGVGGASFNLDGSPTLTASVTFALPPNRGKARGVFRLYAESASKTGYVVRVGKLTTRSSAFAASSWTRVDVTGLLGKSSSLTLTLSDPSPTAIKFAGDKSAHSPELLLRNSKTGAVTTATPVGSGPARPPATKGLAEQGQLVGGTTAMIAAAGDIACDPASRLFNHQNGSDCAETATSNLMLGIPHLAAVLALGDDQYECGRASAFAKSYAPSWGRLKAITHPVPGNHEYGRICHVDDPTPYFQYFGKAAGPFGKGWYSYDIAKWHLIALDSECSYGSGATAVGGCKAGSPQELWLRQDLRTHRNACTLAYWHEPRFSSGEHGDAAPMSTIWNDLVAAHVDVVLSGHNHDYERFAPIGVTPAPERVPNSTTTGAPIYQQPNLDPAGITEFVAGTGGKNHYDFTASHSSVENAPLNGEKIRNHTDFGVLELSLLPTNFKWRFVTIGHTTLDQGSAACH